MKWLERVLIGVIALSMVVVLLAMAGCTTKPMYDVDLPGYVKPVYALNSGVDPIGLKLKECP